MICKKIESRLEIIRYDYPWMHLFLESLYSILDSFENDITIVTRIFYYSKKYSTKFLNNNILKIGINFI